MAKFVPDSVPSITFTPDEPVAVGSQFVPDSPLQGQPIAQPRDPREVTIGPAEPPSMYERAISAVRSITGAAGGEPFVQYQEEKPAPPGPGLLSRVTSAIKEGVIQSTSALALPLRAGQKLSDIIDSVSSLSLEPRPKGQVENELQAASQSLTDAATLGGTSIVRDILGIEKKTPETELGSAASMAAGLAGFGGGVGAVSRILGVGATAGATIAGGITAGTEAVRDPEGGIPAVPGAVAASVIPNAIIGKALDEAPAILKSLRDRPGSKEVVELGDLPNVKKVLGSIDEQPLPTASAATGQNPSQAALVVPPANVAPPSTAPTAAGAGPVVPPGSPAGAQAAPGGGGGASALSSLNQAHDVAASKYDAIKANDAANSAGFLGPFEKFTTKLKALTGLKDKAIENFRAVKGATHGSGGLSKLFAERTIDEGRTLAGITPDEAKLADRFVFDSRTLEIERSFVDKIMSAQATGTVEDIKRAVKEAADYQYPKGMEPSVVRAAQAEMQKVSPDQYQKFSAYKDYLMQRTKEETIDRMKAAGLLTDEQYNALAKYGYNPRLYQRHLEEMEGALGIESGRIDPTSIGRAPVSSLHGGSPESPVTNQMDLLALASARTQSAIQKNAVNEELADLLALDNKFISGPSGTTRRKVFLGLGETPSEGFTELRYVKDGKPIRFQIETELAKLHSVGDPDLNRASINLLGKAVPVDALSGTRLVKTQLTGWGNPFFAAKLHAYGTGFASVFSEEFSNVLPVAAVQYNKQFASVLPEVVQKKGPWFDRFVKAGGLSIYEPRVVAPKDLSEFGKSVTQALMKPTTDTNLSGMVAVYKQAIENGKSDAQALLAARRVNGLQEPSAAIHWAGSLIPYADAGINQSRSAIQYMKRNPRVAAFKAAQVAAIGAGAELWNEAVAPGFNAQIPGRRKTTSLNIALPGASYTDEQGQKRYYGISIPADQMLRGTLAAARAGADTAMGLPVDMTNWKDALTDNLLPTASPTGLFPAPLVVGLGQAISGLDSGMPFVSPDTLREKKPIGEYDRFGRTPTNPIYMGAGRQTGVNPARLEYIMDKLFPPSSPVSQSLFWATRLGKEGLVGGDPIGKQGWATFLNNPAMGPYLFVTNPDQENIKASVERKETLARRPLDRLLGR